MAAMNIPEPPESYLTKYNQYSIATVIAHIVSLMGANVRPSTYWKDPNKNVWGPTAWRSNKQVFYFKYRDPSWKTEGGASYVEFTSLRYDPELSRIEYGTRSLDQNINEHLGGKSKVITNKTDQDIDVSYAEEVSVTNSFSSSVTKGVTLDMSVEVASEQKVGGSYAGVSAEVSLSEKFGVDKSSSKEESKEKSEEGTKSESLSIEFDAAGQTNYVVEITKEAQGFTEPFSIDGVQDYGFKVHFGNHYHRGPEGYKTFNVTFGSIDDFIQFALGRDTDHPELEGWLDKNSDAKKDVMKAIDFLQDPTNRRIVTSGVNHSHLESNVNYNVTDLGKNIPDDMKHLPVVDTAQL